MEAIVAASPPMKHLAPEALAIIDASEEIRLAFCRKRWWVDYPRATAVLTRLDELLALEKTPRPPCMMVVGSSNNGKTTLARRFVARHPATYDETQGITRCPVLYIPIISRPDVREVFHRILEAMGVPYGISDHPNTLRAKVERLIRNFDVRMIIIDEMNTLAAGSPVKQREVLAQIRSLSTSAMIPIVCFTTKAGERMTNYDPAFHNRFRADYLPQWAPGIEWRTMLAHFEGYLPLPEPSGLSKIAFSQTLMDSTSGLLGELHDLLEMMALYAVRKHLPSLTSDLIGVSGWRTPEGRAKQSALLRD